MDSDRPTFEEDLAAHEALAEEGAGALVATLMTRSMASNFDTMDQLYQAEKARADRLAEELIELRADAYAWRKFCAMVQDTILPFPFDP